MNFFVNDNLIEPEPGDLLISQPYLPDPNFERTVVLICEHRTDGSVGFILNKVGDLFNQFYKEKIPFELTGAQKRVVKEINARLGFLLDVGLDYLSLSRTAGTLAGGEAQRIRLASQIGSGLVGTLYVLDEPSIGLHQRDNRRLIETLLRLRDLGNSVLVVEHDEETIRESDWIVDIGPGAGEHGGEVVYSGPVAGISKISSVVLFLALTPVTTCSSPKTSTVS